MLSLFIVLAIQSQDLSKPVTYTSVAKPAKAILSELSAASGVQLLASAPMGKEIVVLHVKDVPLSTLMKRIASATSGEWQQEQGAYRLIRTPATTQRLTQEALAKKTEVVKKAVAEALAKMPDEPLTAASAEQLASAVARLHKSNANQHVYDRNFHAQMQVFEARMPGARLYKAMLASIDPVAIAAIMPGQRVVFSTDPTRMQVRLQRDVSPALKTFVADYGIWAEASKKAKEDAGFGVEYSGPLDYNKPLKGRAKALLAISLEDETDLLNLSLMVGDGEGRIVARHHGNLGVNVFPEPKPPTAEEAKEADLELSPTSKEFATILRESFGKDSAPNVPMELRQKLAATDKTDPLSLVASDGLIGWAKAKGVNLVADLPDISTYTLGVMPAVSKLTTKAVQGAMDRAPDIVVTTSDGWTEVKPVDPIWAAATRFDRLALANFLQTGLTNRRWSLDEFAAYAMADPGARTISPLGRLMLVIVLPELVMGINPDLVMLRIYGSLSTSQRQGLKTGGKFPFAQLSAQQRAFVHSLVFGTDASFLAKINEVSDLDGYDKAYGLGRDPTEFMPNGLPPQGYFSANWEDEHMAYAYTEADAIPRAMAAYEIAWDMVTKESPDKHPWAQGQPTYKLFKAGSRIKVEFNFDLSQLYWLTKFLMDDSLPNGAKQVPFDDLPASFKDEIKKLADQYRQMPGLPSNPGKPPPP